MLFNIDRLLNAIQHGASADILFQEGISIACNLGFEYVCYGLRLPVPLSAPQVCILQNYPDGWMEQYQAQNYISIDPSVKHGEQSSQALIWGDELFADAPQLWKDAQDSGMRAGVAQSCWGRGGSYGLLSLARSAGAITPLEMTELQLSLSWLANTLHAKMTAISLDAAQLNQSHKRLTPRESDVLCWAAEGKTAWEMAKIMHVAERTANFHINNAIKKMGAVNRTQAVVVAIVSGAIISR